ncbi:MAG TPA: MBL fold metallo-hydrolase [Candidatus Binatia bacterium]|jgi:glyoxylase-like metal-dependent hydrolase (beta-lactamase superfamily II)
MSGPGANIANNWKVGSCTITTVVEDRSDRLPPEMFFPEATAADVLRHSWLVPDFADSRGRISMSVQAFVIEVAGRCVVVDPCVGNDKTLAVPYWNERRFPFLERFAEAGFDPARVDTVVHTHLHADHVGWDTQLVGGKWVPTFAAAQHLYTERELTWCRGGGNMAIDGVYEQSIAPIVEAGLAVIVAEDADLGDGMSLEPTPGHTPGHVSLWIESDGATALVSGDFLHHPVQCAEPHWAEVGDEDPEKARATRRAMLGRAQQREALFFGTHFSTAPAGRICADGDVWRFVSRG